MIAWLRLLAAPHCLHSRSPPLSPVLVTRQKPDPDVTSLCCWCALFSSVPCEKAGPVVRPFFLYRFRFQVPVGPDPRRTAPLSVGCFEIVRYPKFSRRGAEDAENGELLRASLSAPSASLREVWELQSRRRQDRGRRRGRARRGTDFAHKYVDRAGGWLYNHHRQNSLRLAAQQSNLGSSPISCAGGNFRPCILWFFALLNRLRYGFFLNN